MTYGQLKLRSTQMFSGVSLDLIEGRIDDRYTEILGAGDIVRLYGCFVHSGGTAGYTHAMVQFGGGTVQSNYSNAPADTVCALYGMVQVLGSSSQDAWAYVVKNSNSIGGSATINSPAVDTANAINIDFQTGLSAAGSEVAALRAYTVEVVKAR